MLRRTRAIVLPPALASAAMLVPWNRDFSDNSRAGHTASRRCSSLTYGRYACSSRLAIRAPRSGTYPSHHGSRGLGRIVKPWMGALALGLGPVLCATQPAAAQTPAENGVAYARAIAAADRTLQAWLKDADPKTGLMPDRLDGEARVATPHNFSADLYPYLILTARLTDPPLYEGRMLEMLRNEVRYMTAAASVPGNLDLRSGTLGEPSLFGAGEYAKDGLITVTELLGRTPWFYRMVDMVADAMDRAPHESRCGRAAGARQRAERRLPAGPGPPLHDDR